MSRRPLSHRYHQHYHNHHNNRSLSLRPQCRNNSNPRSNNQSHCNNRSSKFHTQLLRRKSRRCNSLWVHILQHCQTKLTTSNSSCPHRHKCNNLKCNKYHHHNNHNNHNNFNKYHHNNHNSLSSKAQEERTAILWRGSSPSAQRRRSALR